MKYRYTLIVLWSLLTSNAYSETYIRDYTYKASEADSKLTCRTIALDQVKSLLLQEIGTHIRQKISISKDNSGGTFSSEDIEAITAGLTKVEILSEKWNGESYYLKAEIEADTDQVLNALDKYKNDEKNTKKYLNKMKASQEALKKSRDEVAILRQQLDNLKKSEQNKDIISNYKQKVGYIDYLTAKELLLKGNQLGVFGNAEDKKKATIIDKKGIKLLLKAAKQGVPEAQYTIGKYHQYGPYLRRGLQEAIKWYRKASLHDYPEAFYKLGTLYERGHGVNKDMEHALGLYQKAANKNSASAQYKLGTIYEQGGWLKKDTKKAIQLYKKSANQKDRDALYKIGSFYEYGHFDFELDLKKSLHSYKIAAKRGHPDAKYKVGTLYERGYGWSQDPYFTLIYYKDAAGHGSAEGLYKMATLYRDGGLGVKKDIGRSNNYFHRACQKGIKKACK